MKKWILLLAVFASACGGSLNGTYTDDSGVASYTFQRNGKVLISGFGVETEADYEVSDGKIRLRTSPQGAMVMTLLEDGSIQGPLGVRLTKQSD